MTTKTNPIGQGTCNFPLNIPVDERSVIGRLAFEAGKSANKFVQEVFLDGLKLRNRTAAKTIEEIRTRRMAMARVALAVIGIPLVLFVDFSGGDLRRARTRSNIRTASMVRRAEA